MTVDTGATYLTGGIAHTTRGGTQGGGYSGIFRGSVPQANAVMIAGGNVGGGGGASGFIGSASMGVLGGSTTAGSSSTPANSSDTDRSGAGQGATQVAPCPAPGSNGRIILL